MGKVIHYPILFLHSIYYVKFLLVYRFTVYDIRVATLTVLITTVFLVLRTVPSTQEANTYFLKKYLLIYDNITFLTFWVAKSEAICLYTDRSL